MSGVYQNIYKSPVQLASVNNPWWQNKYLPWNWKPQDSGFSVQPRGIGEFSDSFLKVDPETGGIKMESSGPTFVRSGTPVEPPVTTPPGSGKSGFEGYMGMKPDEWAAMLGAEGRKGVDHMLGSQLKYNLITKQIPQIGRQIGLGGAEHELAAQLAANKNSTAVTMASVMRPGPRTLIQPYRSYF